MKKPIKLIFGIFLCYMSSSYAVRQTLTIEQKNRLIFKIETAIKQGTPNTLAARVLNQKLDDAIKRRQNIFPIIINADPRALNIYTISHFMTKFSYDVTYRIFDMLVCYGLANKVVYNSFITAAGNAGHFDAAQRAFNEAKDRNLADVITYGNFITAAGNAGNYDAAQKIFMEAKDKNLANIINIQSFIDVLFKSNKIKEAVNLFLEHYVPTYIDIEKPLNSYNFHGLSFGSAYLACYLFMQHFKVGEYIIINIGKGDHSSDEHILRRAIELFCTQNQNNVESAISGIFVHLTKKYDIESLENIRFQYKLHLTMPQDTHWELIDNAGKPLVTISLKDANIPPPQISAQIIPACYQYILNGGYTKTPEFTHYENKEIGSIIPQTEGNCLFDAVGRLLNINSAELRHIAVEHTRTDEQLIGTITIAAVRGEARDRLRTVYGDVQYTNVERYLEIMAQDRTWGTYIELLALARALNLRVIGYLDGDQNHRQIIDGNGQNLRTIELDYINGNHFMPHQEHLQCKVITKQDIEEGWELFLKSLANIKVPSKPLPKQDNKSKEKSLGASTSSSSSSSSELLSATQEATHKVSRNKDLRSLPVAPVITIVQAQVPQSNPVNRPAAFLPKPSWAQIVQNSLSRK